MSFILTLMVWGVRVFANPFLLLLLHSYARMGKEPAGVFGVGARG
jgi:hypothetical protein